MKKVLVVDDEANIRELYREEFTDLGYEVIAVADGAAAIAELGRGQFDLAVLDMRMKGMDGIETLRRLKELDPRLPVVISSAYEEYKQDFGSWASEAYIVKSSDTAALRDMVKKLLG